MVIKDKLLVEKQLEKSTHQENCVRRVAGMNRIKTMFEKYFYSQKELEIQGQGVFN